jgi:hypothetical protein
LVSLHASTILLPVPVSLVEKMTCEGLVRRGIRSITFGN